MSASTSITEGGKARPFGPVVALMVEGDDGNYYPWYPEADRALDSLSVTKNGVYQAKKTGVYGWRSVSVNVPTNEGVAGRDPDTGEEVYVHPDPGGELVKDVLPTEIRVTTPPTKTEYTDGETIDYSGIVVHAYSSTGTDLGAVPFNELVFPVTTADIDEVTGGSREYSGLNTGGFTQPIPISSAASYWTITGGVTWGYYWHHEFTSTGAAMIIMQNDSSKLRFLVASDNSSDGFVRKITSTLEDGSGERTISVDEYTLAGAMTYTYDGKTVYWKLGGNSDTYHLNPTPFVDQYDDDTYRAQAAWVAVYGNVTPEGQSIPVQWPRPGDGAILETSFNITVTGGD